MSELRASASSRKRCMSERCWASRPDRPAAARRGARQDPAGAAVAHRVVHEQARGVRSQSAPPSLLLCCPRLCCLLMRSPFAQHGSHVPERAPGHHSVIVATAPLLCPPPSRGAELDGASGSRGCGNGCIVFCDGFCQNLSDLRGFVQATIRIRNSPPFYSTFVAASQLGLWNCAQPRIRSGISLSSLASIVSPSSIDIVGTVSLRTTHPIQPQPCSSSGEVRVRTRWRVWTCAR